MKILHLVFKELFFRKLNFILTFTPIFVAVVLTIFVLNVTNATYSEVNKQMKNLGTNLYIVPKTMSQFDFQKDGYINETIPESYIEILRTAKVMTIQHLIGTIYKPTDINGITVIINGTMVAAQISHAGKKPPLGTKIEKGTIYLGFSVAEKLNATKGSNLTIKNKQFKVDKIYKSKGNREDIMIYMNLKDAQELFQMQGKINMIRALQCKFDCEDGVDATNRVSQIKTELQPLIPEANFFEISDIADIREQTRNMITRFINYIFPALIIICTIWIGLITFSNVKDRKAEIGVLNAIGCTKGQISSLFLYRSALIALLSATAGFFMGSFLAKTVGPKIFLFAHKHIQLEWSYLAYACFITPIICLLASYLPALYASNQDPADILREE